MKDILPTDAALLATVGMPADAFWVELDRSGAVIAEGPFPNETIGQAHPAVRQTSASLGADGSTWAAIFPFGAPFFVYDGKNLRCGGTLIDAGAFPTGPEGIDFENLDNSVWAVAAVLSDSNLYDLPRGRTDAALRSLDVYSLDCRYRHSLWLPREVLAIAHGNGTFYVSYEDPAPTILALRPLRP